MNKLTGKQVVIDNLMNEGVDRIVNAVKIKLSNDINNLSNLLMFPSASNGNGNGAEITTNHKRKNKATARQIRALKKARRALKLIRRKKMTSKKKTRATKKRRPRQAKVVQSQPQAA